MGEMIRKWLTEWPSLSWKIQQGDAWERLQKILMAPNPFLELPIQQPRPPQFPRLILSPPWQRKLMDDIIAKILAENPGTFTVTGSSSWRMPPWDQIDAELAAALEEWKAAPKFPVPARPNFGEYDFIDQYGKRVNDPDYATTPAYYTVEEDW